MADVAAFEALPEETQALARKVLTGGAGPHAVDQALAAKLYRQGWEDCGDEMGTPYLSDSRARDAAAAILKKGVQP